MTDTNHFVFKTSPLPHGQVGILKYRRYSESRNTMRSEAETYREAQSKAELEHGAQCFQGLSQPRSCFACLVANLRKKGFPC
jgi:hypothetical protein